MIDEAPPCPTIMVYQCLNLEVATEGLRYAAHLYRGVVKRKAPKTGVETHVHEMLPITFWGSTAEEAGQRARAWWDDECEKLRREDEGIEKRRQAVAEHFKRRRESKEWEL